MDAKLCLAQNPSVMTALTCCFMGGSTHLKFGVIPEEIVTAGVRPS